MDGNLKAASGGLASSKEAMMIDHDDEDRILRNIRRERSEEEHVDQASEINNGPIPKDESNPHFRGFGGTEYQSKFIKFPSDIDGVSVCSKRSNRWFYPLH